MSADMMLVCREEGSTYDGTNTDKAVFVTETSMGCAHDAIGRYLQAIYCNEADTLDQIEGIKTGPEHDIEIDEEDVTVVEALLKTNLSRHKSMNEKEVIDFFKNHIGKKINIERW